MVSFFFLENYELDKDLELSSNSCKLFQHMPHLRKSGLFGMVFEHLRIVLTWKTLQVDSHNWSIMFSCHIRSHPLSHCTCPYSKMPFTHDQSFWWCPYHYCRWSYVVSPHWLCLMLLVLGCFWNFSYIFNLVSRGVMFQKLCVVVGDIIQFFYFICTFYAFQSP